MINNTQLVLMTNTNRSDSHHNTTQTNPEHA